MQCEQHPIRKVTHKCLTCHRYICAECAKLHSSERHQLITSLELADEIKTLIADQVHKMDSKLRELASLKDYEAGEVVIVGCMNEIIEFVRKLFEQIKEEYRRISDHSWKTENTETIHEIEKKRNILEEWGQAIARKYEQAINFDAAKVYEQNKIDSDEELIDSSESYILSGASPKIVFNETALRRANESLSKIIYTQTKMKPVLAKKLKSSSSSKKLEASYISLCKFVEGTSTLFEYIIQDPESESMSSPIMTRVDFREFTVPFRSACTTIGSGVYLVGGYNRDNKPMKEVYFFERAYTTMRVIGLLKEGRVGHALCAYEDKLYIFGGKSTKTLQCFNTKTRSSQIVAEIKHEICGASMIALQNKLYIIGGTDGIQPHKQILSYSPSTHTLHPIPPTSTSTPPIFTLPISPILQPLSQHEILILGGYFLYAGQSYNNNYMLLFDDRLSYLSVYGKGELIYPILANGSNCVLRGDRVVCLAELKRLRNRHGPNLPVVFGYGIGDQSMGIDCVAL